MYGLVTPIHRSHHEQRKLLNIGAIVVAILSITKAEAFDPNDPARSGYVLAFDDEFAGPSIDATKWRTAYEWGAGTTINSELEYYIDIQNPKHPGAVINPFTVSNGILSIQAAKNTVEGHPYTSGAIATYNSFSQMYGYFEARMMMPSGEGLWPTFWLMPEDRSWPPEIDIAEMIGQKPTILSTTVHDNVNGQHVSKPCWTTVADMTRGYHRYGLLWTATDMTWYFDGNIVCHLATQPSLHKPMYLLLNLAVGSGGWTGTPSPTTPFPQILRVSYVRAYRMRDPH
jgi:beta-glucanase (GH16 family)